MRDRDDGGGSALASDRLLQRGVGLDVDGGRRLVHHDHARAADEGARDAEQLPLPDREIRAILADGVFERHGRDVAIRRRCLLLVVAIDYVGFGGNAAESRVLVLRLRRTPRTRTRTALPTILTTITIASTLTVVVAIVTVTVVVVLVVREVAALQREIELDIAVLAEGIQVVAHSAAAHHSRTNETNERNEEKKKEKRREKHNKQANKQTNNNL